MASQTPSQTPSLNDRFAVEPELVGSLTTKLSEVEDTLHEMVTDYYSQFIRDFLNKKASVDMTAPFKVACSLYEKYFCDRLPHNLAVLMDKKHALCMIPVSVMTKKPTDKQADYFLKRMRSITKKRVPQSVDMYAQVCSIGNKCEGLPDTLPALLCVVLVKVK